MRYLFLLATLFFNCWLYAQQVNFFPLGSSYQIPCDSACVKLFSQHPLPKKTDVYSLSSIAYDPSALTLATTSLLLGDDSVSGPINIGFPFCFFGVNYTTCHIGSNGLLTFNPSYSNSISNTNMQQTLPYSNATFPNNAIFFPHLDVDPSLGGTLKYATVGVAPNRRFIVSFTNVPLFGNAICASNTFYLSLFEIDNRIEVHIGNKGLCNQTNPTNVDYATIGIQDATASSFLVAPNRNASVFSTTNEAWQFKPNGIKNYNMTWQTLVNGGMSTLPTSADTINFCPLADSVRVISTYNSGCPSLFGADTILIWRYRPALNASLPAYNCVYSKETITVNASTINLPLKYSIDGGNLNSNNIFSNVDTGKHTIYIKDSLNCTNSIQINNQPLSKVKLKVDSFKDANCNATNGKIWLHAENGKPLYKYIWNTGDTTNFLFNMIPDTFYKIKVIDSLGCIDSLNVFVTELKPIIQLDSMIQPTCPLSNGMIGISVSVGFGPFQYLWQGGDTTQVITNLKGDSSYVCVVTDAFGCSNTYSQYLLDLNLPNVTFDTILPTCDKSNGSITANVTNCVLPLTVLWSNGQTSLTATGLDSNFHFVTITDANGCDTVKGFLLKDTLEMIVSAPISKTTCGLSNAVININPSMGMAPYNYVWNTTTLAGSNPSNVPSGQYTCTVTDALNCVRTLSVAVANSFPLVLSTFAINAYCASPNGKIYATVLNANTPTYKWNTITGSDTLKNIGAGVYVCAVVDADGCTTSKAINLVDEGKPSIQIIDFIPPVCFGDSNGVIALAGISGVSPYKYSLDGINFQTTAFINNIASGTYKLFIKDANNCTIDTLISFSQPVKIEAIISNFDTLVCYKDVLPIITANVTGGMVPYKSELDGTGFKNQLVHEDVGIGPHVLTIKDSVGCIKKLDFIVTGPDTIIYVQRNIKNVPCFEKNSGIINPKVYGGWPMYNYDWTGLNNDSLQLINVASGNYTLAITDAKGCVHLEQFTLLQEECCQAILPNIFTPNGDNINARLKPIMDVNPIEYNFTIFNRWGNKIFESKDILNNWDGTVDGMPVKEDIYFYYLKMKCKNDNVYFILKGDVLLVR
jgi:gliding motility-associated-like protein